MRLSPIAFVLLVCCSQPVSDDPIPVVEVDASTTDDGSTRDSGHTSSDADRPNTPDEGSTDVTIGEDTSDNTDPLGQVWNTYYWLADEAEHPGAKTVELLDAACDPIASVSEDYADALCIEGSGKLDDGTVVNYHSLCDCGRPCSSGSIICWSALDGDQFPWGQGAFSNPLVPLRSLAVDPDFVALRTPIYIEQFDGVEIPTLGGVEGFTHDGCFRADDTGGAIDDNHIDIFAGTTPMWRHLEGVFPTRGSLDAFTGVGKCRYLEL